MVGLVLVSHVEAIATGVRELAAQMAPEVPIGIAAGIDDPEQPIGTDAIAILEAIHEVWSGDGVLVLLDMGSAVLSAETALEMLDLETAAVVVLSTAPFVEGALSAAVCAASGAALAEVSAEAEAALTPKAAQLGGRPGGGPRPAPSGGGQTGPTVSRRVRLINPLGVHARPAAKIVRAAAEAGVPVTVSNATRGRGPVDALSLNGLATLDLRQGDEMVIEAETEDAVDRIARLAAEGFGEAPAAGAASAGPARIAADRRAEAPPEVGSVLRGLPVSPGVALGSARARRSEPVGPAEAGSVEEEQRRLEAAVEEVAAALAAAARDLAARVDRAELDMVLAQELSLRDPAIAEDARRRIASGASAEQAWREAADLLVDRYRGLSQAYLRSRGRDLESLRDRVISRLREDRRVQGASEPFVLISDDLGLPDVALVAGEGLLGVALSGGTPYSHAAILIRALGVPCVIGLGNTVLRIAEGIAVGLDGGGGRLVVDPPEPDSWRAAEQGWRRARARACAGARSTASTREGRQVAVLANIASACEASGALDAGADGVGLFRTEFLFAAASGLPDEEQQTERYREVLRVMDGRSVTLRTFDAGGDKPLSGLSARPDEQLEAAGFLGLRGSRLYPRNEAVFRAQVRAAIRAAGAGDLRLMFPMVGTEEEALWLLGVVEEERKRLGSRKIPLGLMIEVPSAVVAADRLARLVDFFSIGTNDLCQYLFAADRTQVGIAAAVDPFHPALLRAVRETTRAARQAGVTVAVCGELAASPLAAPLLLGLGVRELSVTPPAIAFVKEAVRAVRLTVSCNLARQALALATGGEVRRLVKGRIPELAVLTGAAPDSGEEQV
jgi:phosphocarrier protein FPr